MPAQRPRASFEPIPPDFDLKSFVENHSNFSYVDRISCDMIDQQGQARFEKLVRLHVIEGGKPLIIDGFEERLDPWTFTPKWLRDNCGEKVENARNITAKEDLPLTMGHYLKNMGLLTNQMFDKPGAWRDKNRQRVYLKDIDCPGVWWDKVKEHIPPILTYLNDSIGDIGGPGAVPDPNSAQPGKRLGKGIAKAADLMSSLPQDMRAENLMCYIGHEGTYTPAHKEMCASLGQNIMVEASDTISDEGKPEKPGSSIWFMTETKDRHLVSEYWLSVLGHDIEVENHYAQVVAWKKAPFNVYIVEQRPGDLVLIPPLAPHQVWNRGTRTMKVAWNRTTVETLEMAMNEALPRARIVCREEQYKNKAIVYYSLQKYASLLSQAFSQAALMPANDAGQFLYSGKLKALQKDFKRLFALYGSVLLSEMFAPDDRDAPRSFEYLPFDSNVTCAYCRGNIFNRFLSCPNCKDLLGHSADDEGDPYDVCMDCYAMGRSCACISGLKWVEQFRWKELAGKYEYWRRLIIQLDQGVNDDTPLSLHEVRKRYGRKTLAEVCKDQLRRRPFKDIKKGADEPKDDEESEEEIIVGDDGVVKKIAKKKSKSWLKNNQPCHVCCHRHPTWKMAKCTTCERSWCYGSLFRGWDKFPLQIMEDQDWSCPHCLGICFAGACKREGKMQPYEPKGTLLGHDTKKVADVRSVEVLVDFGISNLNWLKDDDPANRAGSKRLERARAEADSNKKRDPPQTGEDDDEDQDETQVDVEMEYCPDDTPIDPALSDQTLPRTRRDGRDIDEEDLARRLQQANSSLPPPVTTAAGAPGRGPLDGYAPLTSAGYAGFDPTANMYPNPEDESGYQYPGREDNSAELGDVSLRPFKRSRDMLAGDESGQLEDISMQKGRKQKKPRLAAAGFQSYDLAGSTEVPMVSKARTEVQRQFEKEKERKALDKAKAEGRFIILQATLKGKKRVVKLNLPGHRLAQIMAQQAAKAALQVTNELGDKDAEHEVVDGGRHGQDDKDNTGENLLKSDITPKKTRDDHRREYEQKVRDGIIVSGGAKKALVPVDKDENYSYTYRQRLPNGKRARASMPVTAAASKGIRKRRPYRLADYEEVDIGSDDEQEDEDTEPAFVSVNSHAKSQGRRSLPSYLQSRHEDDGSEMLSEKPSSSQVSNSAPLEGQSAADAQLQQDIASATRPQSKSVRQHSEIAGKRPSMRPLVAGKPDDNVNGNATENAARLFAPGKFRPINGNVTEGTGRSRGRPTKVKPTAPSQKLTSQQAQAAATAKAQAQAAQRLIDEENRRTKLQALQMLEASPLDNFDDRRGAMPDHFADDDDDDDDDDLLDEVPARRVLS